MTDDTDLIEEIVDRIAPWYTAGEQPNGDYIDPSYLDTVNKIRGHVRDITRDDAAKTLKLLREKGWTPPVKHGKPQKLRIYINRKIANVASPNKIAAHAVHAALTAFGVHPGVKVVVLDKGPTVIEQMRTVIHDAGHTELEPGTLTAGTDWPLDSEE
ncbi:peptidyl tRNA hydrolase [Microbacterium phage Pumpernickel]|uniref:Peptidyl tRNA hydrolase n=1 Tax=Microbacterium phage Pumpernickel TaxID=2885983 RepID=A0AAE8Y8J1_9CAUD|nr:peptidyl tRNA hydrolase [Microbacterium phage Pumpernickel]UDL15906.1 peptidyl tRNA hydrolase [Microbacterium phage Pumpernickel]